MANNQTTDRQTILRLSAASGADPRSVRRFLETTKAVQGVTEVALRRACAELAVALPKHRQSGGAK